MKKLVSLSIVFLFLTFSINAQKGGVTWFDVGLKFQGGGSGLYNSQVVDNSEYNYEIGLTNASSFGGKIGVNYDDHGLGIDVMYGTASQLFEGPGAPITAIETTWKSLDIYTLYRNNKNQGYFEIGPKFSLINSVELSDSESGVSDVTDSFNSNTISAVIGFGAYVMGNDGAFSGILGLRFEYGLTDFVNDTGAEMGLPVTSTNIAPFDSQGSSTNTLFAGIVFELNWGLGYFAKTTCGGRSKFIRF